MVVDRNRVTLFRDLFRTDCGEVKSAHTETSTLQYQSRWRRLSAVKVLRLIQQDYQHLISYCYQMMLCRRLPLKATYANNIKHHIININTKPTCLLPNISISDSNGREDTKRYNVFAIILVTEIQRGTINYPSVCYLI